MTVRAPVILLFFAACAGFGRSGYIGAGPHTAEARFERFVEEVHLARLDRDTELRIRLGLPPRAGWPDPTGRRGAIDEALTQRELLRLGGFSRAALGEDQTLSHRLLRHESDRRLERLRWRDHAYLALPGEGPQATLSARLLAGGSWRTSKQAENWIGLARAAGPWLDSQTERLDERAGRGMLAPRGALTGVVEECRRLLDGRPLAEGAAHDGPWLASFRGHLSELPGLSNELRDDLLFRAITALEDDLGPALERFASRVESLADRSPEDRGVWALPDGEAWYESLVRDSIGLPLSPAALHGLGLLEVERLHGGLTALLAKLEHTGDRQSFFREVSADPRWAVPAGQAGTRTLTAEAERARSMIEGALERLLAGFVPAPYVLEPTRAGYEPGPPARVGLDALDPTTVPLYSVLARVARDGLPGRHLRESVTRAEVHSAFRRSLEMTAWAEGWDLYATALPLELGLVADPDQVYGVLEAELRASALLVVDTGLHHERWSPDRARDWLTANTPLRAEAAQAAVDHLLTHPGSSVAAPVGCLRLRELRGSARGRLGPRFDLAGFHRLVLGAGPLPLGILEERVREWNP